MITFERSALYEEVWTAPLTTLGKKYGLSDNGLRKICQAMNIPLPRAGHWAKVAAGHKIPKTPMPKKADRTTFDCHPPKPELRTPELDDDRRWCQEREAQERGPDMRIVVDPAPARWHTALAPIRKRIGEAAKEYGGYKNVLEKLAGKPEARWSQSAQKAKWQWEWFIRQGQLLIAKQIRVSLETYQRALIILNTILVEAEKRGFKPSFAEKEGKIKLDGHDASLSIRISERMLEQMKTVPERYGSGTRQERVRTPSGILRVCVEGASIGEIADETDRPLELRINDVFVKIYRVVVSCREQARRQAQQEREWEAARIRREAEEKCRREEERRVAEENLRRLNLAYESSAWQLASQIRNYVAAVMGSTGETVSEELNAWGDWALQTANDVDPTYHRRQCQPISYARQEEVEPTVPYTFNQFPTPLKSSSDFWVKRAIFKRR